jgi:integrase
VFTATGIRLSELAGLRCSDVDLWQREITVRGKGGKDRIVKIGHQAARSLDRYIRARSRHAQAWRPQLWLGTGNREPLTAAGIYQMIARRGRQCGVDAYPHRFRHHFSHTWLDRGGPEGDLMELNGWTSPQMLRRYGASARSARPPHLRPHHDRHLTPAAATSAPAPGRLPATVPGDHPFRQISENESPRRSTAREPRGVNATTRTCPRKPESQVFE